MKLVFCSCCGVVYVERLIQEEHADIHGNRYMDHIPCSVCGLEGYTDVGEVEG